MRRKFPSQDGAQGRAWKIEFARKGMKFGKDLEKATAGHEWSVYYVDYKQMKKTPQI